MSGLYGCLRVYLRGWCSAVREETPLCVSQKVYVCTHVYCRSRVRCVKLPVSPVYVDKVRHLAYCVKAYPPFVKGIPYFLESWKKVVDSLVGVGYTVSWMEE
jgi:hypothetical protein